jgi:hypothetical protein
MRWNSKRTIPNVQHSWYNYTAEVQREETRRSVPEVARGAARVITTTQQGPSTGLLMLILAMAHGGKVTFSGLQTYYGRPFWWRYLRKVPRLAVSLRMWEEVVNGVSEARGKGKDDDILPSEQPFWQQCIFLWRHRVEELWIVVGETRWQTSQYRLCSTDDPTNRPSYGILQLL